MSLSRFCLAVACIVLWSVSFRAQTEPNLANGIVPYGSFDDHGIGAVNLMNGNLFSHIPFPQDYPQRGRSLHNTPFLVMNGKSWIVNSYASPDGCCLPVNYWSPVNTVTPGAASPQESLFPAMITRSFERDMDPYGNVSTSASNYGLTTWDGSQFGGQLTGGPGITPDTGWQMANLGNFDASGTPMSGVLMDRQGNQFPFSFGNTCPNPGTTNNGLNGNTTTWTCTQNGSVGSAATDTNGNVFGSTDTLQRTVPAFLALPSINTTSNYSGCVSPQAISSAAIISYPAIGGATNSLKICYSNMSLQTSFGVSGTEEYPNRYSGQCSGGPCAPSPLPVTIILPDNSQWTFQYDSYGNVTYIGLPLGGSISYQWATVAFPDFGGAPPVSRAVTSRTVTDNNGHSYTWNYHWMTQQTNGSNGVVSTYTNVMTDPLGNDSVHVFTELPMGYYETTTQYYQGSSSSGQLLQTVNTAFQQLASSPCRRASRPRCIPAARSTW